MKRMFDNAAAFTAVMEQQTTTGEHAELDTNCAGMFCI